MENNTFDRPWGYYVNVHEEPGFKLKKISVKPGKRLSLQSHEKRSEHWVIVSGEGKLIINDSEHIISVGDSIIINKEDIHRAECTSKTPLIIIETQLGDCDEEDITRLEDDWKRQ